MEKKIKKLEDKEAFDILSKEYANKKIRQKELVEKIKEDIKDDFICLTNATLEYEDDPLIIKKSDVLSLLLAPKTRNCWIRLSSQNITYEVKESISEVLEQLQK